VQDYYLHGLRPLDTLITFAKTKIVGLWLKYMQKNE
jgi:hypothetical protein